MMIKLRNNNRMYKIAHRHELLYSVSPKLYDAGFYILKQGIVYYLTERFFGRLFVKGAIKKLKGESQNLNGNDINKLLVYSKRFNYHNIKIWPGQNRYEIAEFLHILAKRRINNMLEIGTASGGTIFLFTRIINANASIYSIDSDYGWHGSLIKSFAADGQNIYLLKGNSHSSRTKARLENLLNGKKLDFLFIDGDHSYEGVKSDFLIYAPFVKRGGLICFHDILLGNSVGKFYNEIIRGFPHTEILNKRIDKNAKEENRGIGILYT